jgi:hypothetical protein
MFLWRRIDRQAAGAMLRLLGRGVPVTRPQAEAARDPAGTSPKPSPSRPAAG